MKEARNPSSARWYRIQQGSNRPLELAVSVIEKTDREHPADAVLRSALKETKGITREESRQVAELVFNWFRWCGWFTGPERLEERVHQAEALAKDYSLGRMKIAFDELKAKAIPPWVMDHMEVPERWLVMLQRKPVLWIRARAKDREQLERTLLDLTPSSLPMCTDALEYPGEVDLFRLEAFQKGCFELQDLSSQAVSHWCDPKPGETWWDACAGEGGKTLHLSDLMQNKGLIWASDRAEWRLKRLKQRTARAGVFNYRPAVWDGGSKLPTKTKFDGVLIDAPCTGMGTWQRNPHARWSVTPNDIKELAVVQLNLLKHASKGVKPGGKLVYSVCTLSRAETTEVANAFQEACPEFEPLPLKSVRGASNEIAHQMWLWPQEVRANGMFVAAWRLRKSQATAS